MSCLASRGTRIIVTKPLKTSQIPCNEHAGFVFLFSGELKNTHGTQIQSDSQNQQNSVYQLVLGIKHFYGIFLCLFIYLNMCILHMSSTDFKDRFRNKINIFYFKK